MDVSDMIQAHRDWKTRFRIAMGTREPLDVERIASDRQCELGAWLLSGAGTSDAALQERRQCLEHHAEFHRQAAAVARAVNEGRLIDAERMLAAETSYADASRALIMALIAIGRQLDENGASR